MPHGDKPRDKQAPIAGEGPRQQPNLDRVTIDPSFHEAADSLSRRAREVIGRQVLQCCAALAQSVDERNRTAILAGDRTGARLDLEREALTFATKYLPGLVTPDIVASSGLGGAAQAARGETGKAGDVTESRR